MIILWETLLRPFYIHLLDTLDLLMKAINFIEKNLYKKKVNTQVISKQIEYFLGVFWIIKVTKNDIWLLSFVLLSVWWGWPSLFCLAVKQTDLDRKKAQSSLMVSHRRVCLYNLTGPRYLTNFIAFKNAFVLQSHSFLTNLKIDGVGPLITDPPTTSFTTLFKRNFMTPPRPNGLR